MESSERAAARKRLAEFDKGIEESPEDIGSIEGESVYHFRSDLVQALDEIDRLEAQLKEASEIIEGVDIPWCHEIEWLRNYRGGTK